jgi:hypothetical protein
MNGMPQSYPMASRNKYAQQRVCAVVAHAARLWLEEEIMVVLAWRILAALMLLGVLAGCAAEKQPSAMEWLESEYLKDPGRR